MPAPTYINIEYIFYRAYIFFKNVYFFVLHLPWTSIYFWARIISVIIVMLLIAGIIYNLVGIVRSMKKKEEIE